MILLKRDSYNQLFTDAAYISNLRNQCKTFLSKHGLNFDKFTVVGHDAFIGYVTENIILDHIASQYEKVKDIAHWESGFDLKKINSILATANPIEKEILYVRDYFYDKWDLKILLEDVYIYIDIKTAITQKAPQQNWNFMYPVVQANKPGKDYMILCYYIADNPKDPETLTSIVLVGYTNNKIIKTCKIIPQGSKTRFGTVSQIDNYETELTSHYNPLSRLLG